MIKFLARDKVPTSEEVVGKFVFSTLPLTQYQNKKSDGGGFCEFVGTPTFVQRADPVFYRGNPIRLHLDDTNVVRGLGVVAGETHKRDLSGVRIICDTQEEAVALLQTRPTVDQIISKHEGFESKDSIRERIEAVFDDVKNRFAPQMTLGEALMKRVAARLAHRGAEAQESEYTNVVPMTAPRPFSPRL